MSTLAQQPGSPSADAVRAELDAVLASELFARAPSLAQFLSYVCRKALHGETDQIKEYSIAVEALGRPADFDQKEDAIVRVEAHRLRKRLKQYYASEGAGHAFEIVIPAGQYVPQFIPRTEPLVLLPATEVEAAPEPVEVRVLAPVIEIPTSPHEPARRGWMWVAGSAIVLVGAVGVLLSLRHPGPAPQPASAPSTAARSVKPGAAAFADGEDGIRIACGMTAPKFTDSTGNVWLSDRYYLGGATVNDSEERIARTHDPWLFLRRREGDFHYRIPLDPGVYELQLYFAERVFGTDNLAGGGETTRLFHVFANGVPLVENMDVIADAPGSNTADIRVYKDMKPAPDGFLDLHFSPFKEKAFINGIAVLPATPGKMRPVRILVGSSGYRDRNGNVWTSDNFSVGGQTIARPEPVAGASEPDLYRSERFGNFTYAIPVAQGSYTVNLYFAEAWWGPNKPTGGGVGDRIFDVYCNGVALLRNFDIFKTAGGANRAVVKSFRGLTPNAQGKLLLSFVPVKNYACLNAIEVLPEEGR